MVQNYLESIPWTKYLGSTLRSRYLESIPLVKIPGTKYHGLKPSFPTCTCFSLHESACIHIRAFWSAITCVYAAWLSGTCVYLFFLHSGSLNCDLSSKWVAIKDNTYVIVPNLCHNANISSIKINSLYMSIMKRVTWIKQLCGSSNIIIVIYKGLLI